MSANVIKVTIEGTSPPVWRRIMIPEKISFKDLHMILQIAFGWEDYHLHDFTFSQDQVRVTDKRALEVEDLPEDECEVDAFLYVNKWVRYTYDLGDGWKHKIVFEKVETDYDLRYATIIKSKGDNFEEDPGGVWGDRPCMEFSMGEANRQLAKKEFDLPPERLRSVHVGKRSSRPSKMEDKIREWGYFNYGGDGREEKKPSSKSCVEVLQDLSQREINDYCKYLQIPRRTSWNKKRSAETIYNEFTLHPEYLLYVLEEEEFQGLLQFCEMPEGRMDWETERFAADKYMALGLMEVHIKEDHQGRVVSYALAQGAGEIIGALKNTDWKEISRKIHLDARQMMECLDIYGIMEVGACYEICRDIWDMDLAKEDFLRLLYWYGRFNWYIRTVEWADGSSYALLSGIDVEEAMARFFQIDGKIDYRKLTKEEVQDHQTSVVLAEDHWLPYVDYLKNTVGLAHEELGLWMAEERLAAMCGATSTEIMDNICGVFTPETVPSWVALWIAAMDVCMDAGLFVLKGNSRSGYKRMMGKIPDFLPVFDRGQLEDHVDRHTHLYQMPEEIQCKIYRAYRSSSIQKAQMLMESVLRDLPDGNLEIIYMLTVCQIAGGDLKQARNIKNAVERESRH